VEARYTSFNNRSYIYGSNKMETCMTTIIDRNETLKECSLDNEVLELKEHFLD
jgi:hypothetical protein